MKTEVERWELQIAEAETNFALSNV